MGNKQDIGKLFEKNLSTGEKTPTETLWEKVNTSLDAEKRRRKRIFYYWLVGGGLTILLGIFLLNGTENLYYNNTAKQKNNTPITEKTLITSEQESIKNSILTLKKDSLNNNSESEEKLSKIDVSTKISEQNESKEPVDENIHKQQIESKKEKTSNKILNKNHTVSKNYYYYNSKDGKQLITNSKREIDSLISEGHKTIDSLTTKKIDSIH